MKAIDNLLGNLKDNSSNKSSSEIAFEKTDPNSMVNSSKNNYIKQLSELKTTLDQSNQAYHNFNDVMML